MKGSKMHYDYTEPVTLTAAGHLKELTEQLKYTINNITTEELQESGCIIEEYGRVMDKLANEYPKALILTIQYFDGMNVFEIKEGM